MAMSAGGNAGGTHGEISTEGGCVPASAASWRPFASTFAAPLAPLLPSPAKMLSLVPGGKPTFEVRSLTSSWPATPSEIGSQSYGSVLLSLCSLHTPRLASQSSALPSSSSGQAWVASQAAGVAGFEVSWLRWQRTLASCLRRTLTICGLHEFLM